MKKQKNPKTKSFLKKLFIKICRLLSYEIIDQSEFYVPTQDKFLNRNLNVPGKKSISIPLGETKITRKVTSLTVIFRSCTRVNMLTQSKKRIFDEKKSEYTFRSLNSIIVSLISAKKSLPNVKLNIIIIIYQIYLLERVLQLNMEFLTIQEQMKLALTHLEFPRLSKFL